MHVLILVSEVKAFKVFSLAFVETKGASDSLSVFGFWCKVILCQKMLKGEIARFLVGTSGKTFKKNQKLILISMIFQDMLQQLL